MTRNGLLALACSTAIAAAACGADNNDRRAANSPAAESPAATGGVLSQSPQEWVQKAVEKNNAEVELGQLAAKRAQNPQVKQYAQTMIDEHTKALDELKQVAASANIQLTSSLNENHQELHEKLATLTGAEFDREYINAMIDEHDDTLEMLEDKADDLNDNRPTGTSGPAAGGKADSTEAERDRINRDLSQWAAKAAPKVRQHLESARQIEQQIDK
jgi:putative membrane protein